MMCWAMVAVIGLQSPSSAPSCTAAAHRQFDFWVGRWTVKNPQGQTAGRNHIESILAGCALQEHWTGARGNKGTSLNYYDPSDARWHQLWLDDGGLVLHLAGGLQGGRMVLEGETPRREGGTQRERISWEPQGPGRVRQLWEQSTDGGRSWKVAFDGGYEREP